MLSRLISCSDLQLLLFDLYDFSELALLEKLENHILRLNTSKQASKHVVASVRKSENLRKSMTETLYCICSNILDIELVRPKPFFVNQNF